MTIDNFWHSYYVEDHAKELRNFALQFKKNKWNKELTNITTNTIIEYEGPYDWAFRTMQPNVI